MGLGHAGKMVQRPLKSCHLHRELNCDELAVGGQTLPAEGTQGSKSVRKKSFLRWRKGMKDRLAGTE